jgi:Protein of unknown function (DUF1203)
MNDTFKISTIDETAAKNLRQLRALKTYIADTQPGYPCRQCLRDAEVGDELVLVSYHPFKTDSPYASASPIFLHREFCGNNRDTSALPQQLERRLLSIRAFDKHERMLEAEVAPGTELSDVIRGFFSMKNVDHVHVHNAKRGCWAARIDRIEG